MSDVTCTVPVSSLPAWVAAGWTVLDALWPVGLRGRGAHARVQWCGVGRVPYPTEAMTNG